MSKESSRDIERMFQEDIRDKRKAGSGAFHRKGKGVKHGISGGIIFAKTKFKRYEKNSKTQAVNVFEEVISLNDFNKFDDNLKRRIILEWKNSRHYSNNYIMTGMGMHYSAFMREMSRLGILNEVNRDVNLAMKELTEEELSELANSEILSKEDFLKLPDWQKYSLTQAYSDRGLSNREIADKLDYQVGSYNTKKSNWKKAYKDYKRNKDNKGEDPMPPKVDYEGDEFLLANRSEEEIENTEEKDPIITFDDDKKVTAQTYEEEYEDYSKVLEFDKKKYTNFFNENGEYNGFEAANKLRALAQLIDGNEKYQLKIEVKKQKR